MTAFMEYGNGTTGVYITSTGEAPGTNRLEISCDMGRVVVEKNAISFQRNVESERAFNAENTEIFGKPECWDCSIPVDTSGGPQHIGILKDFTKALITGSELLAPGYEGVNGLTISNAIHYSAWTGGWADLENFPHDDFKRILDEKIAGSTAVKKEIQRTTGTDNTY